MHFKDSGPPAARPGSPVRPPCPRSAGPDVSTMPAAPTFLRRVGDEHRATVCSGPQPLARLGAGGKRRPRGGDHLRRCLLLAEVLCGGLPMRALHRAAALSRQAGPRRCGRGRSGKSVQRRKSVVGVCLEPLDTRREAARSWEFLEDPDSHVGLSHRGVSPNHVLCEPCRPWRITARTEPCA